MVIPTPTLKITDVRSQLLVHIRQCSLWRTCPSNTTYLEVAKNFPLGENCKCLTNAECASNDCVGCKLFSFGINVPTREFFRMPTGSVSLPCPSDDIVLCLLAFLPPEMGKTVDAARIFMTARTAFANRPLLPSCRGLVDCDMILAVPSPSPPSKDVTVGEPCSAIGSRGPTSEPARRGTVGEIGSGLMLPGMGVTTRSGSGSFSSLGVPRRESVRELSSEMASRN